jgi:hypothetical protein
MSTRFQAENLFEDGGELVLRGTPEMIVHRIIAGIEQVKSEGCLSSVQVRTAGAPDFTVAGQISSYRCMIYDRSVDVGEEIGCIKLQPLPEEQTLFKLMYLPACHPFFNHFVQQLLVEFQRLGFIDFEEEKPPIGFKLPRREKNDQDI